MRDLKKKKGSSIADWDMIYPTFKGIIAAILSDVETHSLCNAYYFLDYSHKIPDPKKTLVPGSNAFFDFLRWLNKVVNQKTVFYHMCKKMNIEYKGVDLDNVPVENIIDFYYRCFSDIRDKLLEQLYENGILQENIASSDKLIESTLDWMKKTKYSEKNCYLFYRIQDLKIIYSEPFELFVVMTVNLMHGRV